MRAALLAFVLVSACAAHASITYPSGRQLTHQYDATGQLTALHWGGQPLVTGLTWNPLGQPTAWQWSGFAANGQPLAEQRSYTDAGQLASSALLNLTWDGAGRISHITQQHMPPGATQAQQAALSSAYTYDKTGRLTASAHSAPAGTALPPGWSLGDITGPDSMGYAWDANGNRTQAHYSKTTLAGSATLQRLYQSTASSNRLSGYSQTYKPAGSSTGQTTTATYTYDATGALTQKGDHHLHQNAQGRIAKASLSADPNAPQAVSYTYNALAQRILKTDTRLSTSTPTAEQTVYADDGIGSTVLGQYSNRRSSHSAAPAGENDSTEIIYLPTANGPMPIAAQINGRLYAIDSDHLNTPRRLTNQQGQVAWQWLITGFGEVNPTSGATGYTQAGIDNGKVYSERVSFNLRYPGQQWDEETNLIYNLNRYYDQESGRYIQADPIGMDGGWNRFVYVGADPLNYGDDEGLQRRSGAPTLSWGQAQLNFQGISLANQIRQYQPNYSYSYASAPGQGFTAANIVQLQGTLQRLQASGICSSASSPIAPFNAVIAETLSGKGNLTSAYKLNASDLLSAGQRFLGENYREIGRPGSGVFRSADGIRQFRIDGNSLAGNHAPGIPHGHLEIYAPGASRPTVNNHIPFFD